jgi:ketosteroid isomerase-like protein
MMMTRLIAWLLLALTVAVPSVAATKGEQEIIDHGKQWSALYEAGKIDEMRILYEPDAWLMTEGAAAAKGVDAILAYLKRNKASGNKIAFSFAPEQITIDGRYGFLISKYWMVIDTQSGQHIEATGRSMLIFKRGKDRKWRIWRDMDNKAGDVSFADRPK